MSEPCPAFCLTLVCAQDIEEKLLDMLLVHAEGAVFTSTPTFSHGTAQGRLSNAEKVMGRSRSVQVQVITTGEELARLTLLLQQHFKGTGLRWWVQALAAVGEAP